jgi:hypothetical protein
MIEDVLLTRDELLGTVAERRWLARADVTSGAGKEA